MVVPVEGLVDIDMIGFYGHNYEVDEHVHREEKLDKDEHRPVKRNHVEGPLNEHECGRQCREEIPQDLVVVADVKEEFSRLEDSDPEGDGEEERDAEGCRVDRNEPLPEGPWAVLIAALTPCAAVSAPWLTCCVQHCHFFRCVDVHLEVAQTTAMPDLDDRHRREKHRDEGQIPLRDELEARVIFARLYYREESLNYQDH